MPKLFSTPDKPITTASDYINRKRNINLYTVQTKNKPARQIVKFYDDNKLKSATNHSNLIKFTKGFYNYNQYVNVDNDFFDSFQGEKEYVGPRECGPFGQDNTNITNYTGQLLATDGIENDTQFSKITRYAEIHSSNLTTDIPVDPKIHKTPIFALHGKSCKSDISIKVCP